MSRWKRWVAVSRRTVSRVGVLMTRRGGTLSGSTNGASCRAERFIPFRLRQEPAARHGVVEPELGSLRHANADPYVKRLWNRTLIERIEIKGGQLAGVALKQPFAGLFLLASSNKGTLVGGPGFEPGASRSRTGAMACPLVSCG